MAENRVVPFDYYDRLRRVQQQTVEDDPVAAAVRAIQSEDIQGSIFAAPPPDQVARASRIARQAGVAPIEIEDRLDDVERAQNATALSVIGFDHPAIGRILAQNPRTAVAAQDDAASLGLLGSAWAGLKKIGARGSETMALKTFGGVTDVWNAIEELTETIQSPIDAGMSALAQASGLSILEPGSIRGDAARRREQNSAYFRGKAEQSADRNRGANVVTEGLLSGLDSMGLTLLAVATRNPRIAAGTIGAVTGSTAYGEAKRQGVDTPTAIRYGMAQGVSEGVFELAPSSVLLETLAKRVPVGKSLAQYMAAELPGELATTLFQSFDEWATLNPDKPYSEWVSSLPAEMRDTALGVLGGGTATVIATKVGQRSVDVAGKVVDRAAASNAAKQERQFFDRAGKAAEGSKLRQRDPDAYNEVLRAQAEAEGVQSVFVPGEVLQSYMQSDSYDQFDDPFQSWTDQIEEAAAAGGDVVLPVDFALGTLPGTNAWAAIKDDMRLSAGGMSAREAETFDEAMSDIMADLADQMAETERETAANRTAIEKLTASVTQKLNDAGFTPSVSRTQAELIAQRAVTRAARMGQEISGNEFDQTEVRQVLPPALAAARKADATDLVVNAMRGGKPALQQSGQTLLQWIAKRGGVNDTGGDIAAMGGDKWHRGKPGQKKLLRPFDAQAAMGAVTGAGDYGIDSTLRAAIDEGFFPELANVANEGGVSTLDASVLLDAIGEEIGGSPRYAQAAVPDQMRAAAEELRDLLSERGLDPEALSDAELRTAIDQLQEAGEGGLEQSFDDGPRGRISFPAAGFGKGPTIIELFRDRNLSTLLHETGHQWLEELRFDATDPDAPEQLKADWQAVEAWFAKAGHPIKDGVIPVDAHELWARGVERYLMEGKAPSSAMQRLFETFRGWLIAIYKTVDRLKSPISPEIREVMDRLIATDEEISAAQEAQALAPLFKDAASAGLTGPEFEAYRAQVEAARGEANRTLLEKTMNAIRRREQKRYRDAREGVEAEIAEAVDARPLYRALRIMKGERISKQWIVDEFGQDALALLPARVPPIYKDGGAHPTGVAELAGYSSGKEMIEALIGAEIAHRQAKEGGDQRSMRDRAIQSETDEEMNRRYGDPLNDGSIEREALAAVHSEMQGEVIASEIRTLARSTGNRPTPYRIARDWAWSKVRSGTYADEASPAAIQRHARSVAKAGREAEKAMLKGDADEAFRFKQQQMLSSALLAEAKAANDEVETARKRMDKIARTRTSKTIDQEYLEQAHALLEAVDLRERTQKSLTRQASWADWAAAREAEGFDITVPPSFAETIGTTNWSRLPVETLLGLDEAVKQVIHLGRLKQTLLDNREQREFDAVVQEAVDGAGGLSQKPPRDLMEPGWGESFGAKVAAMDAGLLKMETVFDWLDGGDSNGVFNRIAFRPIADAQALENDMVADYFGQIRALFETVPAPMLKRWSEVVVLPFANRATGQTERLSRKQLIAAALNTGNEGNLQRLADGYGWNAGALQNFLAGELTAEEWQFVQGVWDVIETLWPQIEAMEKRVNGIAPEKVEPLEIVTPGGILRGGYYPAVYDDTRDLTAEEHRGRETDLFESNYTRASTRSSATKARSEKVSRPILLDLGVINRHLGEVIHDVTHREAVMQAHRFLTNARVAAAVDQALGPEIRKGMRPWVKFVANSWAMERAGNEGIGKFFGKLRANATAVGMGFRVTTAMTQIAGFANSIEVVGEKWVTEAIARSSSSPIESFNFVMERSGEVRHRMDTLDRDIRTAIHQSPLGKLGEVKRFMFHGIGYMDRVVVIPTWLGAYNKALAGGMDEQEAVYAADKAVRQSQGAGSPKDLAAIQRGTGKWGELLKAFTMFYSYFSAAYQRQRTLGRDVMGRDTRRTRNFPRLLARAWWILVVPAVLPDLIKMAMGANGGPDDDEWWVGWTFKKLLANSLGAIPGLRDLTEPAWDKAAGNKTFGYSLSPLQRIGETFVNTAGDAGKIARGEETKHATRDVLESIGYATGLVPGQIAAATQFLVDLGNGDADPKDTGDWLEGLMTGKLKDD